MGQYGFVTRGCIGPASDRTAPACFLSVYPGVYRNFHCSDPVCLLASHCRYQFLRKRNSLLCTRSPPWYYRCMYEPFCPFQSGYYRLTDGHPAWRHRTYDGYCADRIFSRFFPRYGIIPLSDHRGAFECRCRGVSDALPTGGDAAAGCVYRVLSDRVWADWGYPGEKSDSMPV